MRADVDSGRHSPHVRTICALGGNSGSRSEPLIRDVLGDEAAGETAVGL